MEKLPFVPTVRVQCHIPMRFTQWYRFPRHLEEKRFWGMYALLAGAAEFPSLRYSTHLGRIQVKPFWSEGLIPLAAFVDTKISPPTAGWV